MRLWVHTIWHNRTRRVLQTRGPDEDKKFEALLTDWKDETIVAYAWFLYVNADPAPYNLEPVKHVDEFTTKKGNRIVTQLENQSAITRFPLSAFLAVAEGYLVKASVEIDELLALPKQTRKLPTNLSYVIEQIKRKTPSLAKQW